jgi:hypothetical protein
MIGGRLLLRELRITFGQALQFGPLRGRAFTDGAQRQPFGERPEMISEGVLVNLSHVGRINRRKFALR